MCNNTPKNESLLLFCILSDISILLLENERKEQVINMIVHVNTQVPQPLFSFIHTAGIQPDLTFEKDFL